MAVEKEIEIREAGVNASYHRVLGQEASFTPDPYVPGCIGTVAVRIASYASQAARMAGAHPLKVHDAMFRFGAAVESNGGTVAVIASAEPTRTDIYAALQQIPLFAGATAA